MFHRLLFAALLVACAAPAAAQVGNGKPGNGKPTNGAAVAPLDLAVDAREALRRRDSARLALLREQAIAQQHPLASWIDYFELGNRLDRAQQAELDAFYQRWSATYVEDRLRNDWLLELGKRRDWANFAREFPRFRMNDDREVTCYALVVEHQDAQQSSRAPSTPGARRATSTTAACCSARRWSRPKSSTPPTPGAARAWPPSTTAPAPCVPPPRWPRLPCRRR
jgi:hypothetical protein